MRHHDESGKIGLGLSIPIGERHDNLGRRFDRLWLVPRLSQCRAQSNASHTAIRLQHALACIIHEGADFSDSGGDRSVKPRC